MTGVTASVPGWTTASPGGDTGTALGAMVTGFPKSDPGAVATVFCESLGTARNILIMDRVLSLESGVAVAEGTKGGATCAGVAYDWTPINRQSRGGGWALYRGPRVSVCCVVVGCIIFRKLCQRCSAGVCELGPPVVVWPTAPSVEDAWATPTWFTAPSVEDARTG